MFKALLWKLAKKFVAGPAVPQTGETQAIEIGRTAIETYWTGNHEVIKDFSDQFIKKQAENMMEEITKVVTSSDPRMANREKLSSCIIEYAQFQVLLIDPPPAEDPTGLRGQPGITGELKAHLLELTQKDKGLLEFMHAFPETKEQDGVWNCILLRYRVVYAWTHVYHTLRFAFEDANPVSAKDWFRPFLAAMCAWQEHQYRELLGMPPAFEGSKADADKKALRMSFFMNIVLEGVRFPDLDWQERAEEMMAEQVAEAIPRLLAEQDKHRAVDLK